MRSRSKIQLDYDTLEDTALLRIVGEVLLDIRDLLQSLQPKNIIVATEENLHCNCATTKTDGESEHWPQCRYA
jgi:hypothetical protein